MTVAPNRGNACSITSLQVVNLNSTNSYTQVIGSSTEILEFEVLRNPPGICDHELTVEVNNDFNYEQYGFYVFSYDDPTGDITTVHLVSITYDESLAD